MNSSETKEVLNVTRKYDCWAGNPKGTEENINNCVAEVYFYDGFGHFNQCKRRRGFGKDNLYCKIHSKKFK